MNPFARFLLTILAVGIALNLAIVLLADRKNWNIEEKNRTDTRAALLARLDLINGHFRQMHLAVEKQEIQEIESESRVTKSSLLVRPYLLGSNTAASTSLGVREIDIPGDVLTLTGVSLDFSRQYGVHTEDAGIFAGRRLLFFREARGNGAVAIGTATSANPQPEQPNVYSFLHEAEMPAILRLFPKQKQATYFELQLRREIYGQLGDPNPQHALDAGLTIHTHESKPVRLERGRTYIATLTQDELTITPDTTFGLLRGMQEELAKQKEDALKP